MSKSPAFARLADDVQRIVRAVPRGRLITLDAVGAALNIPVRHVAFIASHWMKQDDTVTPWHRLVKRDGTLVSKQANAPATLSKEGVMIVNGIAQDLASRAVDATALNVSGLTPKRPAAYAPGANGEPALANLRGLGPASVAMLATAGIDTAAKLRAVDPFALYLQIRREQAKVSINLLYALIGAIEDRDWREVARVDRTTILLKLDDMQAAKR
jgi:DNA transformation protein and related proteins